MERFQTTTRLHFTEISKPRNACFLRAMALHACERARGFRVRATCSLHARRLRAGTHTEARLLGVDIVRVHVTCKPALCTRARAKARLLGVDVVRVELVEAGLHQPDDVVPRPCEMHYIFVSA